MSDSVKVCIVCPGAASIFLPELEPAHGGAEAQLSWFARELAGRDNFKVHFIVKGDPQRPPEVRENVRLYFHDHGPGLGRKWRLQKLLRRIDADIYLQQAIGSLTKEIAFFCLWRQKPFIYWIGSDSDVNPGQFQNVVHPRGSEWGMRRATLIIAQTQWQMDQLKRNFNRPCVIIRNAMPATKRTDAERGHVLWLARIAQIKQPEKFIELAERIPEHRFLMVGPALTGQGREIVANLSPKLKSLENIEYNPGVPLEQTTPLFETAKLFVLTSTFEGYPNTIMQAMWAGTPIASLHFDPDGLIARKQMGVAPTDDMDLFAKAVRELLSDPDRLRLAGHNARQYAEAMHDIERNVDQLAESLLSIVNSRKSS